MNFGHRAPLAATCFARYAAAMSNTIKVLLGILAVTALVWGTFYFSPFQSCIRGKLDSGEAVDRSQAARLCTIP